MKCNWVYTGGLNSKLQGQKVILYGAGHNLRRFLFELSVQKGEGVNIMCIADAVNSVTDVLGIPVISVDQLRHYDKNIPVIITPERHCMAITETLKELGFDQLYIYNGISCHEICGAINRRKYDPGKYDMGKANNVRSRLADEKSVNVFDEKLNSFFYGKHVKLEDLYEGNQYFPKDIITLTSSEVFVDCGALDGGTILDFVYRAGEYKYIYGFEPVPVSYELTRSTVSLHKIQNCRLYELAVSNSSDEMSFLVSDNNVGANKLDDGRHAPNTEDFPSGYNCKKLVVKTTTLDQVLYHEPNCPTLIKMDIEGAELDALNGAKNIIIRDRPKLAIAAYHYPEHMWEIPLLIWSICPDYKIYFRQHAAHFETICYGLI